MAMISIPAELYQQIASYAQKLGKQPDEVAVRWLDEKARQVTEPELEEEFHFAPDDPLILLEGIISSDQPGWAADHDAYFGSEEHHAKKQ